MTITDIVVIQSHEWGGQIFLTNANPFFNNISFEAYNFGNLSVRTAYDFDHNQINNNFLPREIIGCSFYLKQVPNSQNAPIKYYLLCGFGFKASTTYDFRNNTVINEPTKIIEKNQNGFVISNYNPANTYQTSWSIIKIPNLRNTANVFLIKMNKENDADDGKFLNVNLNPIAGSRFQVDLANTVSSRSQLWDIIRLK